MKANISLSDGDLVLVTCSLSSQPTEISLLGYSGLAHVS